VLRLDGHSYSPEMLHRIVEVAARLHSFQQASVALTLLSDLYISPRHVGRLAHAVGSDLAQQRDQKVVQRRRRQLQPAVAHPPALAVVEVDGGRLMTRQPDSGRGVHDAQPKEDKIACLLSMQTDRHEQDPQPEPPDAFRDSRRVARLVQRLHGGPAGLIAAQDQAEEAKETEQTEETEEAEPWRGAPRRLVRTCVASMACSKQFGPMMAAEAQTRHFYQAAKRAFLADGQQYNWAIQRGYFADFVAVADFIHVLCYLYLAGWAVGADEAERQRRYQKWMRDCWQGRVAEVIQEMACCQERLGRPPPGVDGNDPRQVLADSLRYLQNNQERMDYPAYRQAGLPVTSSLVESLVGEFNARVKGKDKYWDRAEGAEAILQLRAAVLSQDDRLARYFAQRPGCPFRRRPRPD
jgi:hypothetical protein